MSDQHDDKYLDSIPPDFQSTLGDAFATLGVDGRGKKKPSTPTTTRTGAPVPAPKTNRPGIAPLPGEQHLILATPEEIHELIHALAQLLEEE